MNLPLHVIFLVLGLICFALGFFNKPGYNWIAGGLFFSLLVLAT